MKCQLPLFLMHTAELFYCSSSSQSHPGCCSAHRVKSAASGRVRSAFSHFLALILMNSSSNSLLLSQLSAHSSRNQEENLTLNLTVRCITICFLFLNEWWQLVIARIRVSCWCKARSGAQKGVSSQTWNFHSVKLQLPTLSISSQVSLRSHCNPGSWGRRGGGFSVQLFSAQRHAIASDPTRRQLHNQFWVSPLLSFSFN